MEPTPNQYEKDVDEEQLEAQLDDEEGINDDHDIEEQQLWDEEEGEGEGETSLATNILPKEIPGVPGEGEAEADEEEDAETEAEEDEAEAEAEAEVPTTPVVPIAPAPTETRRPKLPMLPTVKTTPAIVTGPTAPRIPTVPAPAGIVTPAPPLPPGYAMIPKGPKVQKPKGKVAIPVYVEPEVDLEELLIPDPMEDPESFRFREKYTYALTALPSPWSDLKASSKVSLGYMAVKKARYGIKYSPEVEATLAKVNELLIPLFATY